MADEGKISGSDEHKEEDPIGVAGAPAPRPFDSSLFDQEDVEKPTSPSFPVESPFMSTAAYPSSTRMESSTSQAKGNAKEMQDNIQDTAAAAKDEPAPTTNYFAGDESMLQSGASFFDSFASARADENDLFSTPPSSIGATPVTPEGPGFRDMEGAPGYEAVDGSKSIQPAGVNSETVSIDSTNLLADDDRKLGSASNLDTMSMDSTNLLSEEDKDDHSTDQGNESFDMKQEQEKEKGGEDDSEEIESGQEALETTIDLESPETEISVLEDSITKSSSEVFQDGEKKGAEEGADSLGEKTEHVAERTKEEDPKTQDGACPASATQNIDTSSKEPKVEQEGPLTDAASSQPQSAQLSSSDLREPDEVTSDEQPLGPPPPLMSSFSAPSGLVNPDVAARPRAPFQSSSSQEGDDPFLSALRSSDSDRRHDAWLPSEATQKILANRSIALQGSEYVIRDQLTMPGIIAEEPQGDPVKDLVQRYMGEQESNKRGVLTGNQVTRDEAGLKRLLDAGCLRAAIDLTGLLLTSGGQGKGQSGLPSRHTPHLMQVWFTRVSLFMKLQQFTAAEQELEVFGNLDKPDLFFEYYPDLYPGRKGSIVPFSFRIIHAELPMYTGKHQLCLDRLSAILAVCHTIFQNLEEEKSEYGQPVEFSAENRKASLDLWKSREVRVLHSVGNCLVAMKEYMQAVNVFKSLIDKEPEEEVHIMNGIARVYLQLGDLKSAQEVYIEVEKKLMSQEAKGNQARIHINRGFLKVAQNQYAEAYKHFSEALKIEPTNFMAINNVSVCCLYLGRLKEALSLLENLVNRDSSQYLDESLIFNLCTLYELESSKSLAKKQNLLGLVSKHRGDGFNVGCLKMP